MKSIHELAREAGLYTHKEVQPELQRFATLVIEQEHARLLEGSVEPELSGLMTGDALGLIGPPGAKWATHPKHYPRVALYTADQMAAAVLRERERIAARMEHLDPAWTAAEIAAAIRGQK